MLSRLLKTNKFYTNFSNEECIVDILSESAPVAGESSGIGRMARANRPNTPAGAYRFVSPQSFGSFKRLFLSTDDGKIIDTTGLVQMMSNGVITGLKDETTGYIFTAGADFKTVVPGEIFGYWQRFEEDG